MKTTSLLRATICAAILIAFNLAGGAAFADEVIVHHDAWTHDNSGYWDDHAMHHAFVMHENHHGFWREDHGTRVFVNID